MIQKKIMRNKGWVLIIINHLLSIISFAQIGKAPAYPLVVHDPYFSIWSFSDKLNESTTKHWTGADHSLIGALSVDGKWYNFLGQSPKELKPILPDADMLPYEAQFTETKPDSNWMNVD